VSGILPQLHKTESLLIIYEQVS